MGLSVLNFSIGKRRNCILAETGTKPNIDTSGILVLICLSLAFLTYFECNEFLSACLSRASDPFIILNFAIDLYHATAQKERR